MIQQNSVIKLANNLKLLSKTLVLFLLIASFLSPSVLHAHDIPSRITLQIYVQPLGNQMNILMRIPMEAMSEISFPTRGPGYLNFSELDSSLQDAVNIYITDSFAIYENDIELDNQEISTIRVALPSNRSFINYQTALASVNSVPLTDEVDLLWQQAELDLLMSYPIESENSQFSIDSSLSRLGLQTNTVLRFVLPEGSERVFNYFGNPGLIQLDPSLFQSLSRFLVMGFTHILDGIDHLLFLFCLIIPLRNIRQLIPVVTAFTVAHSITLISSAFGLIPQALWFPPLIETLIALSIVYMAFENIIGVNLKNRWMLTYGFGLVHGFGFSFLLAETMQFAAGNIFTSLLAFNIGVELGQILVLIIVIPLLHFLFKRVANKKITVILLSTLIAHSAWHWLLERWNVLLAYNFEWPLLDTTFLLTLTRWGILIVITVAILWGMYEFFRYLSIVHRTDFEGNEQATLEN